MDRKDFLIWLYELKDEKQLNFKQCLNGKNKVLDEAKIKYLAQIDVLDEIILKLKGD